MSFSKSFYPDVECLAEIITGFGEVADVVICRTDVVVRYGYVGMVRTDNFFLDGKSFLMALKRFLIIAGSALKITDIIDGRSNV